MNENNLHFPQRLSSGTARIISDTAAFVMDALQSIGIHGEPRQLFRLYFSSGYSDLSTTHDGGKPLLNIGMSTLIGTPSQDMDVYIKPDFMRQRPSSFTQTEGSGLNIVTVKTFTPRDPNEIVSTQLHIADQYNLNKTEVTNRQPVLLFAPGNLSAALGHDYGIKIDKLKSIANICITQGYRLVVATSPRTGEEDEALIDRWLRGVTERKYFWQRHSDTAYNPYLYFLNYADAVVVTGESLSMMSDSINQGKKTIILFNSDKERDGFDYMEWGTMVDNVTNEGLAQLFRENLDLNTIQPADSRKTGWQEVRRAIQHAAINKLNGQSLG